MMTSGLNMHLARHTFAMELRRVAGIDAASHPSSDRSFPGAKRACGASGPGRVGLVPSDSTAPTRRALACLPKAAVRDTQRMIAVATPERAGEIAARWPDAQHWGMEIRALMHSGGEED
jgi:hypothetical protein